MDKKPNAPEIYQEDIRRAVKILKDAGCTDIFLFGSVSLGRPGTDIDLAVRGCSRGQFFRVLGRLLLELNYPVDLVDLDRQDAFARYLEEQGELLKIA